MKMAKIKINKVKKMTDLEKKMAELQAQQKKAEAEFHQSIGSVVCNNWDVEINPDNLEQVIKDLSHIANKMLEESSKESNEDNNATNELSNPPSDPQNDKTEIKEENQNNVHVI